MTSDNVRRACLVALITACTYGTAFSEKLTSSEITSNNIYMLAGRGDTLWMATDQGLNYTIDTARPLDTTNALSWHGYNAPLFTRALGFGGGFAVACLDTEPFKKTGRLWYYSHAAESYSTLTLPFKPDSLDSLKRNDAVFMGVGITWIRGFFWIACVDGGLVRWNPAQQDMRAFYPNSGKSYDPAAVRLDSATTEFTVFPDSSRRVIAVSAGRVGADTVLFVCTPAVLYRFHPSDTSWESVSSYITEGGLSLETYHDVFSSERTRELYAGIAAKNVSGGRDTTLYRYDSVSGGWVTYPFLRNVRSLTFGPDSIVYLAITPNNIQAAAGSRPDTLVRTAAADTLICGPASFLSRISVAMNNNTPDSVSDVLYLPANDETDSTGRLWIGMYSSGVVNNGLFFSRDERKDERDKRHFIYIHRERKIQSGLKQTYAYPGILNGSYAKTIFAYSLSRKANVTIAVYDWNMNLVKVVTPHEPRPAGKDDPLGNGRSTDRERDVWDGTNSAGKRVAVGVYYFKITAEGGESSFGKIIVAK